MLLDQGSIQFWYYGLAYSIGFIGIHLWFRFHFSSVKLTTEQSYNLTLIFIAGVLIVGRAFEIVVYEGDYYARNPHLLWYYWRGGMASHGVLLGGILATWIFARLHKLDFLEIIDEIVIPGAFLLALGRIGNFINGQIYGSVTDVWWGVHFPDSEGFRHPVTLYQSLKNLLMIPILWWVRHHRVGGRGIMLAHFIFWYGFLRIFTDGFREYGTKVFGIGTGQYFNISMAVIGAGLIWWYRGSNEPKVKKQDAQAEMLSESGGGIEAINTKMHYRLLKRGLLVALLLLSLTIPSGWTLGVLEQLRDNHP